MKMKARMMKILRVAARSANHQFVPNVEAKPKRRERRWNVVRVHIDWNMNILIWYTIYCIALYSINAYHYYTHLSGKASSNVHNDSSDDETKASKSSKKITKASAKSAVSTKKKSAPLCNKNPFVAKAARQLEEAKAAEMSTAAAKKKPKGTKKTTLKKSRKYDVDFDSLGAIAYVRSPIAIFS